MKAIEQDLPRAGRTPKVDPAEIVRLTTQTQPASAGAAILATPESTGVAA